MECTTVCASLLYVSMDNCLRSVTEPRSLFLLVAQGLILNCRLFATDFTKYVIVMLEIMFGSELLGFYLL